MTAQATLPSSPGGQVNGTIIVNPLLDDIETNYDNNNLTGLIEAVPPADLQTIPSTDIGQAVFFSNGTVIKSIFEEGEPFFVLTNISNVGNNKSFSANVAWFAFQSDCSGDVPISTQINCSPSSPYFDADLCDGSIDCRFTRCTGIANLETGQSTLSNTCLLYTSPSPRD